MLMIHHAGKQGPGKNIQEYKMIIIIDVIEVYTRKEKEIVEEHDEVVDSVYFC